MKGLTAFAVILFATAVYADEAYPPGYEFITDRSFIKSEHAPWAQLVLSLVEKTPNDHRSEVMLELLGNRLTSLPNWGRDYLPRLEALLAGGLKNKYVERNLRVQLAKCYLSLLRKNDAEAVLEPLALLEHWWALPVPTGARSSRGRLYLENAPEQDSSLEKEYDLGWRRLGWQDLYLPGRMGTLSFEKLTGLPHDTVYIQAQVRLNQPRKGLLCIAYSASGDNGLAVWVNGVHVSTVDPEDGEIPGTLFVPVALAEGWNRLMIKLPMLGNRSGMSVCLMEPDGTPVVVEEESGKIVHETAGPTPQPEPMAPKNALIFYRGLADGDLLNRQEAALAQCVYSMLASIQGLNEEAYKYALKAYTAYPSSPVVRYFHAKSIMAYSRMAEGERKNRARDVLRKILEDTPEFAAVREAVAEDYYAEDKLPEAFAVMEEGLKQYPDSLQLRLDYLDLIARSGARTSRGRAENLEGWGKIPEAGWFDLESAQLDAIEALSPELPSLPSLRAGYWQRRSQPGLALGILQKAAARSPTTWLMSSCYDAYLATGNVAGAITLGRKMEKAGYTPDGGVLSYPAVSLSELLFSTGQVEEALERIEAVCNARPYDTAILFQTKLPMLKRLNRLADVETVFDKLLALAPGAYSVITYREKTEGAPPFYTDYVMSVEERMKDVGDAEDYPESSTCRIIDQKIAKIFPDGTMISYNHEASKILNSDGINRLKNRRISGKVLDVRTITPDGEVLEPTFLSGNITMPGLSVGAVVESKSIEFVAGNDGRIPSGGWYFQDPQFSEPFLVSEYVLMVPKTLSERIYVRKSNFENISDPEPGGDRDNLVYRWTAKDMPRLQDEPGMPGAGHILPVVHIDNRETWNDINYSNLRNNSNARPEDSVKSALQEALTRAGIDTAAPPRDIVAAVHNFVADEIVGEKGGDDAVAVLQTKSGNRLLLMSAMLRAAGLKLKDVFVYPSRTNQMLMSGGPIDWLNPSTASFVDRAVAVELEDGGYIWLRADSRYLPPFVLPDDIYGGVGFIPSGAGGRFVPMPASPPVKYTDRIRLDMSVDLEETAGTLVLMIDATSAQAAGIKRAFKESEEDRRNILARSIANHFIKGAELAKWTVSGDNDRNKPFVLSIDFKSRYLVTPGPRGYEVSLGIQPLNMVRRLIAVPERKYPLVLPGFQGEHDDVVIRFDPAKWRILRAPESATVVFDCLTYNLVCALDAKAGTLTVSRTFTTEPGTISPADYDGLAKVARRIDNMDNQHLILVPVNEGQDAGN
ncbi:MAG: hypothetical protein JW909_11520 [Planctomycetes bacterium]|nr:hypothetical protein [Planctomycetota bacterium]